MCCFVILLLSNEMEMSVRRFSAIPHLRAISSLHLNRHHSRRFAFEALLVLFHENWDPRDKTIRDKNAGIKIGTGIGFWELYPDAIFDDVGI